MKILRIFVGHLAKPDNDTKPMQLSDEVFDHDVVCLARPYGIEQITGLFKEEWLNCSIQNSSLHPSLDMFVSRSIILGESLSGSASIAPLSSWLCLGNLDPPWQHTNIMGLVMPGTRRSEACRNIVSRLHLSAAYGNNHAEGKILTGLFGTNLAKNDLAELRAEGLVPITELGTIGRSITAPSGGSQTNVWISRNIELMGAMLVWGDTYRFPGISAMLRL